MLTTNKKNRLIIVVPAYNEEEALGKSLDVLQNVLLTLIKQQKVSNESKLVVVNDGSKDKTWQIIEDASKQSDYISGINFSRNFGHQNAIIGGLTASRPYGDVFITIDADLQDDVKAIYEMVDNYLDGYDVVYGARNDRETDSRFKRWTADTFYKLMNKIGVELVPESADFRLTSGRVVDELLDYPEQNLFLRGILPSIGFPSTVVYYKRKERELGESKYPLRKMLALAWDGITSFSIAPMHLVLFMGILTTFVSFVMLFYTAIQYLNGHVIQGWSSLMVSIWFIGGIQLIALSIIGEYIGKVFKETKKRPRFIIQDNLLK
ncbi:glycosyltransferase family 2 protein [Fructobacillus sp. M1-13]|uniref:Glycosyltransferase family 2 protein n=1 Tax=Fructobacillus papyriferae TaxID=2713171 RepID=A0ABS5QR61_9LACO|nr:glycosyltransferase family 2 protein [Fructobacillus papyriferae]MBS9334891.1 glycosyltransferase family 2 protein [Fructobacillus papyriferae]MCD2158881.1 glycosyltransferase family 2 protein [Fructobacillus papyriferae]